MHQQVYEIDKSGFYLRDVLVEYDGEQLPHLGSTLIEIRPPDGLYRGKWDGSIWIEGATLEYIQSIKGEPKPSWEKFRQLMMASDVYDIVAAGSPGKASVLTNLLFQVGGDPTKLPEAVSLWNVMVTRVSLSAEQVTQLRDAATQANLPLAFDDTGKIITSLTTSAE